MKKSSKFRRALRYLLAIILTAWLVPLLISVNFWKQEVAVALSEAFHRPVHVGNVHLQMVGGFGFQVSDVVVEEDPAFGAEPFARIETADARVSLLPLLRGRVELSRLSLISPSFNVVRNTVGEWNLSALREAISDAGPTYQDGPQDRPTAATGSDAASGSPRIHVEDGRVNFKVADLKKAYRIDALAMDLIPPASAKQPWKFQVEGMMSRSDRPFRPTSVLHANGELGPILSGMPKDAGIPLHLDWSSRNAPLAELLTVLTGRDLGVHGQYSFDGHLAGTTSLFRIAAKGRVEDLHRWDLLPPPKAAALRAEIAGIVDLSTQTVELNSLNIPLGSGEVVVRGRVEGLFGRPKTQMEIELQQAPLSAAALLLPQFTTRVPQGFRAEGVVQGSLRVEGDNQVHGKLDVSSGYLQAATDTSANAALLNERSRVRFASFPIIVEAGDIRVGPVTAKPSQGGSIQATIEWDVVKREAAWRLQGDRISIPAVEHLAADFGWASNFLAVSGGMLSLQVKGIAGPERTPEITGTARLSNVTLASSRSTVPLKISAARAQFQKGRVTIQPLAGAFGSLAAQGTIAIRLPAAGEARDELSPAVQFTLDAPLVDVREVARMLAPPENQNFFFALGRRAEAAPSPLDEKIAALLGAVEARGTVHVAAIRDKNMDFENLNAQVALRAHAAEISEFSLDQADGTHRGSASATIGPEGVSVSIESRFANVNVERVLEPFERWRGAATGLISGTLQLSATGDTWQQAGGHWTGSGEASGSKIVVHDARWSESFGEADLPAGPLSFTAAFHFDPQAIHFPEMKLVPHAESGRLEMEDSAHPVGSALLSWSVAGDVGLDGRLNFTITSSGERGESRIAGTIESPQVSRRMATATTAAVNTSRGASVPPK